MHFLLLIFLQINSHQSKKNRAAERVLNQIRNAGSPLKLTPHTERQKVSEKKIEKPKSLSLSQIVEKKLQKKYAKEKKIIFVKGFFENIEWPFKFDEKLNCEITVGDDSR